MGMDYLVRFAQLHEPFRIPELEALAEINQAPLRVIRYEASSPFCIVRLENSEKARSLISRAILCKGIYELWGRGANYDELHAAIRRDTVAKWQRYRQSSFRFRIDCFKGSRSASEQRDIVNSFAYMGFTGSIRMKNAEEEFTVFEEYGDLAPNPPSLFFGRLVGYGGREAIGTYSLKKRHYLSTTSMDSELALIGANLALADTGKIVYDPFIGTGSLPVACAHFGALAYGSDIDPRPLRGKGGLNTETCFRQYGLQAQYLDSFIGDLTHPPLRAISSGWLDAIVCDPPYGVREGLRVLGSRSGKTKEALLIDGKPAHLQNGYIPPKQPYSFEALLADIMNFAACMLVDNGRLSFWMPTANDAEEERSIPSHPALELVSNCVQPFNNWSRRLLTYRLIPGASRGPVSTAPILLQGTADDLNNFRKRYFEGFKLPTATKAFAE